MSGGGTTRISAAVALHSVAVVCQLAADFRAAGIPMLVLKGPLLQERLFGTFAAYPSLDADVLVRPGDALAARRLLEAQAWQFDAMFLWRLSKTGVFERDGVVLDLHWGLHVGTLPSAFLRPLEQALWTGATAAPHGLLEPALEPLLVYLAVHAAGHRFARDVWVRTVAKAAEGIEDWDRVWTVARASRTEVAVRRALAVADGSFVTDGPLLDGWRGSLDRVFWVLRGHFLPTETRAALGQRLRRLTPKGKT